MNDDTKVTLYEEGWLRRWEGQRRVVQVLGFLGLFVLIAGLDFVVDRDLSLFALFLISTLYSAWFLGIRWDILASRQRRRLGHRRLGRGSVLSPYLDSLTGT
jgi:hypothetical protein